MNCVYCGAERSTTRDHVPPRSLFPKPIPTRVNLITVPSCARCNARFSKDDEYFATVMAGKGAALGNAAAQARWDTSIRALGRPQAAGFKTAFRRALRDISMYSPGGIYLGQQRGLAVQYSRIRATVERCVRGLYFHEKHIPVPVEYDVRVTAPEDFDEDIPEGVMDFVRLFHRVPTRDAWGGVFRYKVLFAKDAPTSGALLIQFYETKTFLGLVSSEPREHARNAIRLARVYRTRQF